MRGLPTNRYDRLVARYEIKFSICLSAGQSFSGLPLGTAWTGRGNIFDCVIVLLAYTAEDALTDLRTRLDSHGYEKKNILIDSVLPTDEIRPTPTLKEKA